MMWLMVLDVFGLLGVSLRCSDVSSVKYCVSISVMGVSVRLGRLGGSGIVRLLLDGDGVLVLFVLLVGVMLIDSMLVVWFLCCSLCSRLRL